MVFQIIWLAAGWVVAAVWLYYIARIVAYTRGHRALLERPMPSGVGPRVTVIVPACNEAAAVEQGLRSLLGQVGADVRIVAVNDRSTDETGAIMELVAAEDSRLAVAHIHELPAGWLGKNNANWRGAQHSLAQGSAWLLFTDGDIHFDPGALARAVAYAEAEQLDLLCVMPDLYPGGYWEMAMCQLFGLCYMLKCNAWNLQNPRRPEAFTGMGAFNLARRATYDRFGGHERLRMEVLDDYKLGRLTKQAGGKIGLLRGGGALRVRWHVGLRGVVRGLEKNAFAGFSYSLAQMIWSVLGLVAVALLPPIAAVLTPGPARWGWVVAAAAPPGLLVWFAVLQRITVWVAVGAPVCAAALSWACIRATWLTIRRGGVQWRGTFYPLAELKAGMV